MRVTKKYLLSCLFTVCTQYLPGQELFDTAYLKNAIEHAIEEKCDSLRQSGVDTVIQFYSFVEGWPAYADSAGIYEIQYLIWPQNSGTFIQKFVNLNGLKNKRPPPVEYKKQDIFLYLRHYLDTIRSEIILPFIYKGRLNGIELYDLLNGTHRQFTFIRIRIKGEHIQKEFYNNDLKKDFAKGHPNLNYEYNNQTKLKYLYDLISTSIGKIDWY